MLERLAPGMAKLSIRPILSVADIFRAQSRVTEMDEGSDVLLSLQAQFTYESLRRSVRSADDMEKLRAAALQIVEFMESQQRTVNQMLRQGWLKPPRE